MTPTFDWSNQMNVSGNKDRSFAAPGANAVSSIFNTPGVNPAPMGGGIGGGPAFGAAPLNIMPQNNSQQPGQLGLQGLLKLLQGAFGQGGVMGGGTMAGGANNGLLPPPPLPPASPLAAAMVAKKPQGGLY